MNTFDGSACTSSLTSSQRPLPLKQRTSSVDTRRDYNATTWRSLLVLLKAREYVFTVDNFSIWRRHLAWAMEDGKDLRSYMTGRYASNMVFMSLLLSTELGVLFNSSDVTHAVRVALKNADYSTVSFWAGFFEIISALLTLLSLFSTFTAWAMVNAVDESNAHCIFRSSIGQYAAELPGRLIVCSIYTFLVSFFMFFFLLLPFGFWSVALLVAAVSLFVHVVATFSALGRIVMHAGAMGRERIFDPDFETTLLPHSLHANLLAKARANLANNTSITRQYRKRQNPIDRHYNDETELYNHLCCQNSPSFDTNGSRRSALSGSATAGNAKENIGMQPQRRRTDSLVRFADEDILGGVIASSGPSPPLIKAQNIDRKNQEHALTSMLSVSAFSANIVRDQLETALPSHSSDGGGSLCPPRPKPIQIATFRTSSSSLEQWLQASTMPSQDQDSDAESCASPLPSQLQQMRRSPPTPFLTNSAPPPNKIQAHQRENSASMSSIDTLDCQDLTENERFVLDYGGSNSDNNGDGFEMSSSANDLKIPIKHQTQSQDIEQNDIDAASNDIENQGTDGEFLSLLGNKSSNAQYDSTDNSNW